LRKRERNGTSKERERGSREKLKEDRNGKRSSRRNTVHGLIRVAINTYCLTFEHRDPLNVSLCFLLEVPDV